MRFFATVFLLLYVNFLASAEDVSDWIKTVKDKYPTSQFISEQTKIDINFEIDEITGLIKVYLKESHRFKTITSNASIRHTFHYSDRIKLNDVVVTNAENRRSRSYKKICGNVNIGSTFYSDAAFCSYSDNFPSTGEVLGITGELEFKDIRYFTRYFLSEDFPIQNIEINVHVPSWLELRIEEFNFTNFDIERIESSINNKQILKFKGAFLMPIVEKGDQLPKAHVYPHLIFVPSAYHYNGTKKSILSSTSDLYKFYKTLAWGIRNDSDSIKVITDKILSQANPADNKIKILYEWVRENIKYIAFEEGIAAFKPTSAQEVYYNRYGDCKGMANLLKEMLITQGHDARLAWVGSNKLPYDHSIPSICVDNHMICVLVENNEYSALDATAKYSSYGDIPLQIRGKELLIENDEEYIRYVLPENGNTNDVKAISYQLAIQDDQLKGQGKLTYDGYSKISLLSLNNEHFIDNDLEHKVLKNLVCNDNIEPDDIELKRAPDLSIDAPFEMEFTMATEGAMTIFEDDIYLSIDLNKLFQIRKVNEERDEPYNLNRPFSNYMDLFMTIPNNYQVTHVPEITNISNDLVDLVFQFETNTNSLTLKGVFKSKKKHLDLVDFQSWNNIIDQISDFFNDQIILSKNQ